MLMRLIKLKQKHHRKTIDEPHKKQFRKPLKNKEKPGENHRKTKEAAKKKQWAAPSGRPPHPRRLRETRRTDVPTYRY